MTGVSVSRQRGADPLSLLLPIATDPEGTSQRLAELTKATAEHMKAVELHGKTDEIESLLGQAKKDASSKRNLLSKARETAKGIVAKAEEEAKGIVSEAGKSAADERAKIKTAQDRLRSRENSAKEKEENIDPLYAEAKDASETAQQELADALRLKETLQRRATALKEAAREALK